MSRQETIAELIVATGTAEASATEGPDPSNGTSGDDIPDDSIPDDEAPVMRLLPGEAPSAPPTTGRRPVEAPTSGTPSTDGTATEVPATKAPVREAPATESQVLSATREVRPGDHLWSLAAQVLGEAGGQATDQEVATYWRQLVEANRDRLADPANPDLIFPGQVLALPAPAP